jgi:hypothetical protein
MASYVTISSLSYTGINLSGVTTGLCLDSRPAGAVEVGAGGLVPRPDTFLVVNLYNTIQQERRL